MSNLLCILFAVCGLTTPVTSDTLPSWGETSAYAVPVTQQWEGSGPTLACDESPSGVCVRAYLDTIADPDVWTVCFGETFGVEPYEIRTMEACEAGLSSALEDIYWTGYRAAIDAEALAGVLRPETDAALTSLTWNIGIGAVTGSTAVRRLNAGDVAGACEALTWWNRAGGRVVRGLTNRRADEYQLCMLGAS